MSRAIIPKELQSAYQRWEMTSFGQDEPSRTEVTPAPAMSMPTLETVAKIHDTARLAGYAAGLAEGHAEGLSAGLAEGRNLVSEEINRLRQIAEKFGSEVARADELIAQDMLSLSLDIAKAMLRTALVIRPELVIPIVSEAIGYLPTVQQPAHLILHPDDALLIKQQMGNELTHAGWQIHEDVQLERGGCRIETSSNEINASASSRWQRIAHALGKESEWLAP